MSGNQQDQQDVRIYVGNIGANVTQADIVEFFELDQFASVKLSSHKKKNFAFITLKRAQAANVLRKNGNELYGRQLVVTLSDPQKEQKTSCTKSETPKTQSIPALTSTEFDTAPFTTPPKTIPQNIPPPPQKAVNADDQQGTSQLTEAAATAEAGENTGTEQDTGSNDTTNEETTKCFVLRFPPYVKPYRLPTMPEVVVAGYQHFQVQGMKCIPIRTRSDTCYKFELLEEVPADGHVLEFPGMAIPLSPWVNHQRAPRRDGLLLTFYKAGQGELEFIPGSVFDEAIEHLKLVPIVRTRFQFHKQTQVLNGNRMCVVETPENLKVIPESIPIENTGTKRRYQVSINFRGQERFCSTCNETHVGGCPVIAERRKKEAQREEMKKEEAFTTKFYSDSTLRCVDVLGLRSEVLCMSGGGLGQIIQAAIDDPEDENDKIVIFGGTNDAKASTFQSTDEFAHNIDMACAKLITHAKTKPDKTFYLVQQCPVREENSIHPEASFRELYRYRRMKQLEETVTNIETFSVQYDADPTGHPTVEGTKQIIDIMDTLEIAGKGLIWDEHSTTTDKPYSKVQSVYRYGCNGCHRYGTELVTSDHNSQLLCDICYDTFRPDEPNELLVELRRRVEKAAATAYARDFPDDAKRKKQEDGTTNNDNDMEC